MAARSLAPQHQETVKDKIQASQLVNLLQKHALNGKRSKIDPTRIKAAEILLARCIPVLQAVEQTIVDSRDQLSESDIATQLAGTLSANPDVILKVLDVACVQPGMAQRIIDHCAAKLSDGGILGGISSISGEQVQPIQ